MDKDDPYFGMQISKTALFHPTIIYKLVNALNTADGRHTSICMSNFVITLCKSDATPRASALEPRPSRIKPSVYRYWYWTLLNKPTQQITQGTPLKTTPQQKCATYAHLSHKTVHCEIWGRYTVGPWIWYITFTRGRLGPRPIWRAIIRSPQGPLSRHPSQLIPHYPLEDRPCTCRIYIPQPHARQHYY